MPRYLVEIVDGNSLFDPEGIKCADLSTARRMAVEIVAERLKGNADELLRNKLLRVTVSDETGAVIAAVAVTVDDRESSPARQASRETRSRS